MPTPAQAWRTAAAAIVSRTRPSLRLSLFPSSFVRFTATAPPAPATTPLTYQEKAARRREQLGPRPQRLSPLRLPKPPFLRVKDPTVFAHPSLKGHYLPQEDNVKEEEKLAAGQRGKRKGSLQTYERHELIGKQMIELVVMELLTEKYSRLSPHELDQIHKNLVSTNSLSRLSRHYDLASHLRADPISITQVAAQHAVQASLFRSYAAGLYLQEGMAYVRQWLRQVFRSVINDEYDQLRQELARQLDRQARQQGGRMGVKAYEHLQVWLHKRKIVPKWRFTVKGVPPNQVFKAELTFMGARALGGGRTVQAAKQQAAAVVLGLQMQKNLEPLQDLGTYKWAGRLRDWCLRRKIKPTFMTLQQVNPVFKTTLRINEKTFEAHGLGKVAARSNAAKLALAELDPEYFAKFEAEDAAGRAEKQESDEGEVVVDEEADANAGSEREAGVERQLKTT